MSDEAKDNVYAELARMSTESDFYDGPPLNQAAERLMPWIDQLVVERDSAIRALAQIASIENPTDNYVAEAHTDLRTARDVVDLARVALGVGGRAATDMSRHQ